MHGGGISSRLTGSGFYPSGSREKSFSVPCLFPPSINNLFLNIKRGGRLKTAKYRAWEKQADAATRSGIAKLQAEVLAVGKL